MLTAGAKGLGDFGRILPALDTFVAEAARCRRRPAGRHSPAQRPAAALRDRTGRAPADHSLPPAEGGGRDRGALRPLHASGLKATQVAQAILSFSRMWSPADAWGAVAICPAPELRRRLLAVRAPGRGHRRRTARRWRTGGPRPPAPSAISAHGSHAVHAVPARSPMRSARNAVPPALRRPAPIMQILAGTSGWSYGVKGVYRGSSGGEDADLFRGQLGTVELNNTFYRLPKRGQLASWAEQVPPEFRFGQGFRNASRTFAG